MVTETARVSVNQMDLYLETQSVTRMAVVLDYQMVPMLDGVLVTMMVLLLVFHVALLLVAVLATGTPMWLVLLFGTTTVPMSVCHLMVPRMLAPRLVRQLVSMLVWVSETQMVTETARVLVDCLGSLKVILFGVLLDQQPMTGDALVMMLLTDCELWAKLLVLSTNMRCSVPDILVM